MTGRFERELGLLDCVLLSLGGMVGSAIFVFPGTTGQLAGPASIAAWVLAGVLMVAIALCYTELALAFPEAGAPAVFPRYTLGPWPALRSFASYLEGVGYAVGWVIGITVSALAIPGYLNLLLGYFDLPAVGGTVAVALPFAGTLAVGHGSLVAVATVLGAATVNVLGVDVTSKTNLLLSGVLVVVFVVFVAVGLGNASSGNYAPFLSGSPLRFVAAVNVALTAYGAWTAIPAAVEEIRDPVRVVPRAILLSLAAAALLYGAVVATIHGLVPSSAFTEGATALSAPLRVAVEQLGVNWLVPLLSVAALTAITTTILVGIMGASRVLYALGDTDTLPRPFASRNDAGIPDVGVLSVTAAGAVLSLFPGYFYELIVVGAVVGTGLPYAINILSFVGFRHYRTDLESPFTAPGGNALAVVAFLALVVVTFGLSATEITWALGTLALLTIVFLVRAALNGDVLTVERDRGAADRTGD